MSSHGTAGSQQVRLPVAVDSAAGSRTFLIAGAIAGPLWIAVAGLQALLRDGFDLSRHPISVLSNGDLGWIQIANFVVCGLLFVVAATGLRRRLGSGPGATWGPRLVAVVGVGMIASGVFVADPLDGFPRGTPAGTPETISWHGGLHFLAASISFIALLAVSFVLARRFGAEGEHGFARGGRVVGVALLAAWVALFAFPLADAANIGLAIAAAAILAWVSSACGRLARIGRLRQR